MRTIFRSDQIEELQKNPNVFNCSERFVHYTYEFKIRALDLPNNLSCQHSCFVVYIKEYRCEY